MMWPFARLSTHVLRKSLRSLHEASRTNCDHGFQLGGRVCATHMAAFCGAVLTAEHHSAPRAGWRSE
jgi:hypothetical protein